jgi:PleD family two-component response regulator
MAMTILIVDDSMTMPMNLKTTLTMRGFKLVELALNLRDLSTGSCASNKTIFQ